MSDADAVVVEPRLGSQEPAATDSSFRKIARLVTAGYAAFRSRRKSAPEAEIIDAPKGEITFRDGAPVRENLNNVLRWLAQRSTSKPSFSDLRFVDDFPLTELPLPLEESSIPSPVKIQQAWWFQWNGTKTSVLFLHKRKEPISENDIAVVVCAQLSSRTQEGLQEGYRRAAGHMGFAEILAPGGLKKLEGMFGTYGMGKEPQPTAEQILAKMRSRPLTAGAPGISPDNKGPGG